MAPERLASQPSQHTDIDGSAAIIRAVPTRAGRRVGIGVVLVLLAVGAGLAFLPFGMSTVRVGGISVLWWYAGIVAPCTAVVVTIVVLFRFRRRPSDAAEGAPSA